MLLIPRDGEARLWVRRSYERAVDESLFAEIRPMRSYRDAAASMSAIPATVYLETEQIPLAAYDRLRKHFPFKDVRGVDREVMRVRAVKSPFETRSDGAGRRDPPPRARGPRARDPPGGDERGGADERALRPDGATRATTGSSGSACSSPRSCSG